MPGTLMTKREWECTEHWRRTMVREFGLRSWDMLSAEQADTAVWVAARYGIDAADRYLAPINAAHWSCVRSCSTLTYSLPTHSPVLHPSHTLPQIM
jgi:hypothetical protein